MALELLSFIAKKTLIKNIPASIAKGSKKNQRTFRSSWSNVVAILKQSERGDLETKFKFFIACALYVPPLVIMGSESNMADGATDVFNIFFMVKFVLKSLQDVEN